MRMREIDPREAHAEMKADPAIVYVDVRTVGEYQAGHPEGAWNIPVLVAGMLGMKPNPEFLEVASRVLPKDAPVIVGCKSGQRSAMACQMLAQAGFHDLANVAGGFHDWAESGLPVSPAAPPGRSWDELKRG
jgi:rhodanese-related sulfurtransferase